MVGKLAKAAVEAATASEPIAAGINKVAKKTQLRPSTKRPSKKNAPTAQEAAGLKKTAPTKRPIAKKVIDGTVETAAHRKGRSLKKTSSKKPAMDDSHMLDIKRRYLEINEAPPMTATVTSITEKVLITREIEHLRKIKRKEAAGPLASCSYSGVYDGAIRPCSAEGALPSFKGTFHPNELADVLKERTAKLVQAIGKDMVKELIQDICLLAHAFAAAASTEQIRVRLERVGDDGCAYWHQGSVPYRLVATYRGPCTEFVHPDHSNATLRKRKEDSQHAQAFTHSDVALFKGRGPTEYGDPLLHHPGIVHRSPRIKGSRIHRLILVLNLPDDEEEEEEEEEDALRISQCVGR